jgi:serine protease AprX
MFQMGKVKVFCFVVCILSLSKLFAQETNEISKYWVFLKDKPETQFDPHSYFDEKAIQRRLNQNLASFDWYDLPVNPSYRRIVEERVTQIKTESRWLNAFVVYANESQIESLLTLNFVKQIENAGRNELIISEESLAVDSNNLELLQRQTERMGIEYFDSLGLHGEGMRIAIFDVGFNGAKTHPAFEHIYKSNRVKLTYDFVKNREDVYSGGSHGTAVWSCIGGKLQNKWSGLAHESEYLLARTEIGKREPFSEEENWIAAAEWADKNGADIINSSLGYTNNRYFTSEMDGKTSYVTRGANIAAKKGILVINAAGNEGSGDWKIIGAPADADSVLTIGGVVPCCDYKISFSSFGPTADGRMKPNVMAQGRAWCAKPTGEGALDGTSFASPLAAGFAACAWQSNKELSNMQMFAKLEQCGHLYPYFDFAHGYGVLNAKRFIEGNSTTPPTFAVNELEEGSEKIYEIKINDAYFDTNSKPEQQLIYVSFFNLENKLDSYQVIEVSEQIPVSINASEYKKGQKAVIYFKGYINKIDF